MAEKTKQENFVITNPFEIVGKTIRKVEKIERTETITSRELEDPPNRLSSSGSASSTTRLTFSDGTQIEV